MWSLLFPAIPCYSLLFLAVPAAQAATYYVATTGNDANAGTSSASPFRHLSKAAAAATQPGDTVMVMDGTYDNEGVVAPNFVVTLTHSGTAGNPITFKAQNRGMAILDAGNTTTDTSCNGAAAYLDLKNASFIVLQGFVIQHGCDSGIQSNDTAHDITIRWNEIRYIANRTVTDQIGRDGIYMNTSEYNFTFDGNIFHDIGRTGGQTLNHFDHGIYSHAQNVTIMNNLFYNMTKGFCIQNADGANNVLVANNTFALSNLVTGEPGQIIFWGNNTNMTLRNNIFDHPTSSALNRFQATVSGSIDHNLVNGATSMIADPTGFTVGTNQLGVDPLFVNAAALNFHLQSNSPAIDTGVTVPQVTTDFDGVTRPQGAAYDVGAFEYIPATTSPCDVNKDGAINVQDVQIEVNMALGISSCNNPSGTCNVVSVQRVVNAALGGPCVSP
jgi:hypothetical protein